MDLDRRTFLAGMLQVKTPPPAADHSLTIISGDPRQRGLAYGRKFAPQIRSFLDKEIYGAFSGPAQSRDAMLTYADRCRREVQRYSPIVTSELEGMAEGAGIRMEEAVLLTLHEEFYHRGTLPAVTHCTALAAGPPDTTGRHVFVAQSWDWFERLYGLSSVLLWKRPEGPSLISYSYPGLWAGAGMNSAGVAMVWTSVENTTHVPGPRAGIPTYVLLAQMLYQDSLEGAVEEARRARQAGWFTLVLADAKGRIANVEASPVESVVEFSEGHLARTYYGTRRMTRTPEGQPVKFHPQVRRMWDLLDGARGRLDLASVKGFYGDHQSTICKHYATLDVMIFDPAARETWFERGPGCSGRWARFSF